MNDIQEDSNRHNYFCMEGPKFCLQELGVYNLNTKSYKVVDTGFTSHTFVRVGGNGMVYCVAGSPTKFSCVVQINTQTGKVSITQLITIAPDKVLFYI